jgi:hypothetical protein
MAKPELLIDIVYRLTFRKPFDIELRRLLVDARRCVLSNEMAAFLYTLMFEIYSGGAGGPHWRRRCYRRLDDCRHFSRLPHRVTWVEYDLHSMLQREVETRASTGVVHEYSNAEADLIHTKAHRSRVGWLFVQHDKIETAFLSHYFVGGFGDDGMPRCMQAPTSVVWCTDDEPLPWPGLLQRPFKSSEMSASAFVAGIPGYDRPNVGLIASSMLGVNSESEVKAFVNAQGGRARMMWAFLATFNKVPIIGSHTVVPARGFVARGAYHKFLEHKFLTINIPEKAGIRKVARATLALIRRRAHMVRGHWRDDWRLPQGNKSLWIAEHQRGDASLGFVVHDYNVKHDEP